MKLVYLWASEDRQESGTKIPRELDKIGHCITTGKRFEA